MFVPTIPIVGQSSSLAEGPSPLQVIGPCIGSSKTHYWEGEIYSSGQPTINASGIQTTVVTPSGNAESGYGYFELLSVFDSGGHYDQLGFANNCGTWVQLLSFTSLTPVSGYSCVFVPGGDFLAAAYYCGATGMATFAEGTAYTYEITIPSSGNVEFQIIQWSGQNNATIWSTTVSLSGANSLVLENTYSGNICPQGCPDYTDYEELYWYTGSQDYPSYNVFYNHNIYEVGSSWISTAGDWSKLTAAEIGATVPSAIIVQNSYDDVTIFNTATGTATEGTGFFTERTALVFSETISQPSIDLGQSVTITFGINDSQGITATTQDLEILFPSLTGGQTASCSGSSGLSVSYYPSSSSGLSGDYGYSNSLTASYGYANAVTTSSVATGSSFTLACTVTPSLTGTFTFILESPMGFYVGGPYGGGMGWIHWPSPVQGSKYVTDFKGEYGVPFTIQVYPTPSVYIAAVPSQSVDVGQRVTFTAKVSGGSGGYYYAWSIPFGCSNPGTQSNSCNPTSPGTGMNDVAVLITDSNGFTAPEAYYSFTVYPDPSADLPSASRGSVDVGQSVTFSITALGGSGGYSITWQGLPPGCFLSNSANLGCTPTGSGTFSISVGVTDSNGYKVVSSSLPFVVDTDPTASSSICSPSSVDIGRTFSCSVNVSGGSGGNSYSWVGFPPGCSSSNSNTFSCTPTSAGTFAISVTVTDSNGYSVASAPSTVTAFDYSLSNNGPVSIQQGMSGSVTVTVTLTSGTDQPVTLSCVASSLSSGITCGSLTVNPVTVSSSGATTDLTVIVASSVKPGSYSFTVTGSPLGATTTPTPVGLTVTAASSSAAKLSILGLNPTLFYEIIGVLLAIIIVAVALVFRRSRKHRTAVETIQN